MWFWDKEQSLREIWRILAPAGVAVIGGGYGTAELKKAVYRKMSDINGEDWSKRQKRMVEGHSPDDYALVLEEMGPWYSQGGSYKVVHEESGDWLILRKRATGSGQ
jgi:hypothetical protein